MLSEFMNEYGAMLGEGIVMTLYMTLVSTFFAYILGIPMGIILVVTASNGLKPNSIIYKIMDVVVNIVRSIPFLILLIMVIPLTKAIVGKSYGPSATIVPLVLSAAPFTTLKVKLDGKLFLVTIVFPTVATLSAATHVAAFTGITNNATAKIENNIFFIFPP